MVLSLCERYIYLKSNETNTINDDDLKTQKFKQKQLLKKLHPSIRTVLKTNLKIKYLTQIQLASCSVLSNCFTFDTKFPFSGDIYLAAPTGQGKTLAYLLPILSELFYEVHPKNKIRALIVAPTLELTLQIGSVASKCCENLNMSIQIRYLSNHHQHQHHHHHDSTNVNKLFQEKPFSIIVITTPARLIDSLQTKPFEANDTVNLFEMNHISFKNSIVDYKYLRWIVIDEVDRLFEQTLDNWMYHIYLLSEQAFIRPQKILASATLLQNPEHFKSLNLLRPTFFISLLNVNSQLHSNMSQYYCIVPKINPNKLPPVYNLMLTLIYVLHQIYHGCKLQQLETNNENFSSLKILIFCNSKKMTSYVTEFLNHYIKMGTFIFNDHIQPFYCLQDTNTTINSTCNKITSTVSQVTSISDILSNLKIANFNATMSQKLRLQYLKKFQNTLGNDRLDILVCSDVASRGLDFKNVNVVIQFEIPHTSYIYIHRCGRTARAGKPGSCITLVPQEKQVSFQQMFDDHTTNADQTEFKLTFNSLKTHEISKDSFKNGIFFTEIGSPKLEIKKNIMQIFETCQFPKLLTDLHDRN